jgi:hypothetical protein
MAPEIKGALNLKECMLCCLQMDDNAAPERALEIYTSEYPRLNAMLEGLRAWIILKVFMTLHTHFLDREAQ